MPETDTIYKNILCRRILGLVIASEVDITKDLKSVCKDFYVIIGVYNECEKWIITKNQNKNYQKAELKSDNFKTGF